MMDIAGSEAGEVHVVVDRHVITGQNDASTLIAVQNLILLSQSMPSTVYLQY